jgi:hypothetical protein
VGVEPVLEGVDGGGLYHAVRQVVPGADHSLAEDALLCCSTYHCYIFYFFFSSEECLRDFRSSSGSFSSPEFPERYPNGMDCAWIIVYPLSGHYIKLTFTSFNLEDDCNDYLTVGRKVFVKRKTTSTSQPHI